MIRTILPSLLICALVAATPALGQSDSGEGVVERARAAAGGAAAWNRLRGVSQTGELAGQRWRRVADPIRYGLRLETLDAGGRPIVQGYNGAGEWRILADGARTGSAARQDLAEVRSEAYFAVHGYFFSSRFERRMRLLGARTLDGKTYDVVRIEPEGGEPRDIWFDRRSGLPAIMVDETGPRQGRTIYDDWRRAGGVMLPFAAKIYERGREAGQDLGIRSMSFDPVDRAIFSLPPSR